MLRRSPASLLVAFALAPFTVALSAAPARADDCGSDVARCTNGCYALGRGPDCTQLGRLYLDGRGVASDGLRAASALQRGCDAGDAPACRELGAMLRDGGRGLERDRRRSAEQFARACDKGDLFSCNEAGTLFASDEPGLRDLERGAALRKRACAGGVSSACAPLPVGPVRGGELVGAGDKRAPVRYQLPVAPGEIARGPADAKVTIVEWADYQCPFSKRAEQTLAQLRESYPRDVRIVVRQHPLPFHEHAHLAAEAAMAAKADGAEKFWRFHDKLYESSPDLGRDTLVRIAGEVGLDVARFTASLDGGTYTAAVDADVETANRFGAQGTPTFFVNGTPLVGAQPILQFSQRIDAEIAHADALLRSGTPRAGLYPALIKGGALAAAPAAPPSTREAEEDAQRRFPVEIGRAPVRGDQRAPVTIVEFADFQCPFCARADATMKRLLEAYPGKVRLVWKHRPLPFHANAMRAAVASVFAQRQGRFWELHDALFAQLPHLEDADIDEAASRVGLSVAKLHAALTDPSLRQLVEKDDRESEALVPSMGTPTFFINGRKVVGAQPYERFQRVVDEELAAGAPARGAK